MGAGKQNCKRANGATKGTTVNENFLFTRFVYLLFTAKNLIYNNLQYCKQSKQEFIYK